MAHSVGGKYGIPHGVANSILLPYGMEFNLRYVEEGVPAKYKMVADALSLDVANLDDVGGAMKGIDFVREFTQGLDLPQNLSEVGLPADGLDAVTEDAMIDGSMFNNPGEPEYEEVLDLYKKAL
jgi:alcohol dehydrogenase class IV